MNCAFQFRFRRRAMADAQVSRIIVHMTRGMSLLCLALSATGMAAPPPARIDQMAWLAGQ